MARTKEIDAIEREALLIGYNTLLSRVVKELEVDTGIQAVLIWQRKDLEKRIREVSER